MILGRNPALWVALFAAALNAVVLLGWATLSTEQIAALNAVAIAFIGLLANESDPTTQPTFARSLHPPTDTTAGSSGATASPSGTPGSGTAATGAVDTSGPSGGSV